MNFYILAGGRSRRMGCNKALLKLNGATVIERIVDAIPKGSEIRIVTNSAEDFRFLPLKMVADIFPGVGPIAGIHAGLSDSKAAFNFFLSCDMPLVSRELIDFILSKHKQEMIFGVRNEYGNQVLCAIYARTCIPIIEEQIRNRKYSLQDLTRVVNSSFIESPSEAVLFNLNTREDFEELKKICSN